MLGGGPPARLRQHKVLQNFGGARIRCTDNHSRPWSRETALLAMVPLQVIRRVAVAGRVFACIAGLVLAGSVWAAEPGPDPGQPLRLTPEQRRDMWERMTPAQREAWRGARSQEERQRAWQGLSPEQRRGMWEGLSPEQRELMLRRLPPEQRQDMRRHMTPEERQAMRQRFIEQAPPGAGPGPGGPPPRPMHQMSPEERQRLREQIREAQRDVYRGREPGERGDKGGRR